MHFSLKKLIFIIFPAIFFCACSDSGDRKEDKLSFCYWDTSYSVDTTLLKTVGVNHFYIRYFDIDWDPASGMAKPIASVESYDSISINFTPSVFITNKVFEKSSKEDLKILSSRVKKRVEDITTSFGYNAYYRRDHEYISEAYSDSAKQEVANECKRKYKEVLIDCDWTAGTRDKFFYFIKCLKQDFKDKDITVTLRLWQYKKNKPEDIPPVDRCLLMCYNMQTATDYHVQNSIASLEELKKYVSGKKYPLTLDVALPVFSWAVLFRGEKFIGLLGNTDKKQYADNIIEYEDLGNGKYRSLIDKVIGDFFIRKGDIIRVEEVSKTDLDKMADYLKSEIPMDKYSRLTFFSWNKLYINNYGTDEIKNIYTSFTN